MDDDVAFNRGEDQEQQVTHNGPVQIDVPQEVKKSK
jgi:hypothetical protein